MQEVTFAVSRDYCWDVTARDACADSTIVGGWATNEFDDAINLNGSINRTPGKRLRASPRIIGHFAVAIRPADGPS
jgi:hypothetical protein